MGSNPTSGTRKAKRQYTLKLKKQLLFIIIPLLIIGVFLWLTYFETKAPEIFISPKPGEFLTATNTFTITFKEKGCGLKEVGAALEQDKFEQKVYQEVYPRKGEFKNLLKEIKLDVYPRKLGLHDGEATLKIYARDHSLWHWPKGNYKELIYNVKVDATLPTIEILTRAHNLRKGGAGLVAYRAGEELVNYGVKEDGLFFPGYKWQGLYLNLFAFPYDASQSIVFRLVYLDKAGNKGEGGFYYNLIPKTFKHENITVTDNFLRAKMPEFWNIYPELEGKYLETFLKVNRDLRHLNHEEIKKACQVSQSFPLWHGAFLRMKGAPSAGFADYRVYYYRGKEIDRQVHLGIDIASLAHWPIPAANDGIVVYKGYLGIYGNVIIIDHGLGLFSLYGHLSSFQAEKGQKVCKGDIIGYTGTTGLAGGDHLHFSILIHGVFVDPREWWDPHWMKDNVYSKLSKLGLIR